MTVSAPPTPELRTPAFTLPALLRYTFVGMLFGIVMTKSEAASWYRMQEMFRFQSFHMFGIIGSAILTGLVTTLLLRRLHAHTLDGEEIRVPMKAQGFTRYALGGLTFGLGWGLSSACPAQIFITLGTGARAVAIVLLFALLGTWLYNAVKDRLPH